VTARLIPEDPEYVNSSERSFTEALRDQLPDDAVMFINQRLTDHESDREADVILAWPGVGIAVIEVKGGSVSLVNQEWRQRWQGDSTTRKIDPVGQARRAKYWLRDYLDAHPRWTRGRPRLAHLIALTATELDDTFTAPTDAPRWMIIDRSEIQHTAARISAALRQAEGQPAPPSQNDIDQLVDCLAGVMIPQRDLLADLAERESTCDLLSKDQANVLDSLSSHTQVEIRGGAGSGKTWLAVEKRPDRLMRVSEDVRAAVLADLESRRSADPGAMAADRVVIEWIGPGTAPFRVRKGDFEFTVDEPTERGGTNTAPNPLAYFLAGAASCLANHYISLALSEDISLRALGVVAVGRFDRVLVGGAFRDISYDVRMETDEPAVRIQELAERADVMCFASNTLANAGVILTTRIFVNGAAVATLRRDARA